MMLLRIMEDNWKNYVQEEAWIKCGYRRSLHQLYFFLSGEVGSKPLQANQEPPVLESIPSGNGSKQGAGKRSDLINHVETVHQSIHF